MNDDLYIQLIYKQLTGQLEEEEQAQLETWLAAAPSNKELAEQISHAWKASEQYPLPEVQLDLDEEFAQLELKIDEEEGSREEAQIRPLRLKWMQLAAAAVILFTLLFVWNRFTSEPAWQEFAYEEKGEDMIQLHDGSQVWLRKGAILRYPTRFSGLNRNVELKGEALFEVAHNAEKSFKVKVESGVVEVLGTRFYVKEEELFEVYVINGKVKQSINNTDQSVILEAEDYGVYDKARKTLGKTENLALDEDAWQAEALDFDASPVKEVLQLLRDTYSIEVELENVEMENCLYTYTLRTKNYEEILETFEDIYGMELVKLNASHYQLKGGNCE